MGLNIEYDILLKRLLPPGLAFPALPGSNLDLLLKALSQEIERISNSATGLITESNPRTMSQMLYVRREEAGLPDPCRGEPDTFQAKVAEVVAKWNLQGKATLNFMKEMCVLYGYDVQITEGAVGTHTFTVDYVNDTTRFFRAGKSTSGEPLQLTEDTSVHCLINRIKPAHTYPIYVGHATKTW